MKFYSLVAMLALVSGHKLHQQSAKKMKHACDYLDDKGEEIDTSLAVQLESKINMKLGDEPDSERVGFFAQKLGIEMTPELMQLGSNEAISQALVEMAVGMGKSEEEIGAALDTIQGA